MASFLRGHAARQLWEERLDRLEASGQSVKDFCAAEGLNVASLYQWRRRLRSGDSKTLVVQPSFRSVGVIGHASLEVRFDGIGTLEVPTSQHEAIRVVVSELARAVKEVGAC